MIWILKCVYLLDLFPDSISSWTVGLFHRKLQKEIKLDQVYCAWLKKGLLCLYILYWVSIGLVCLYILEKVDIWSGDTDASQTDRQQNIGLLSFSPVSSLSWVTQYNLPLQKKLLTGLLSPPSRAAPSTSLLFSSLPILLDCRPGLYCKLSAKFRQLFIFSSSCFQNLSARALERSFWDSL